MEILVLAAIQYLIASAAHQTVIALPVSLDIMLVLEAVLLVLVTVINVILLPV